MDSLQSIFQHIPSLEEIIRWGGYFALFAIIFSETGLLVGFFLPGDSLLVSAGLFCATGELNVWVLLPLLTVAAILGNSTGYLIGKKTGPLLFKREDSLLFKRRHLTRAHEFYEKYGRKTIVLAQFVPIVRTFAPTVAGAAEMEYRTFITYNVVGAFLWIWSMVLAGFKLPTLIGLALGREFTAVEVKSYLHFIIIGVVFLSILPGIVEWLRAWRKGRLEPQVNAD
jgi:membrane-associated protein